MKQQMLMDTVHSGPELSFNNANYTSNNGDIGSQCQQYMVVYTQESNK